MKCKSKDVDCSTDDPVNSRKSWEGLTSSPRLHFCKGKNGGGIEDSYRASTLKNSVFLGFLAILTLI